MITISGIIGILLRLPTLHVLDLFLRLQLPQQCQIAHCLFKIHAIIRQPKWIRAAYRTLDCVRWQQVRNPDDRVRARGVEEVLGLLEIVRIREVGGDIHSAVHPGRYWSRHQTDDIVPRSR